MTPSDTLQRRLETSFGAYTAGLMVYLWDGKYSVSAINGMTLDDTVHVGCLAKSLTSTLVAIAEAECKLDLSSKISTFLPGAILQSRKNSVFGHICIGHLLNHTHGLDAALITELKRNKGGYIDTSNLLSQLLDASPLAAPGVVYNYSNAGYWLVAAILEHIYGDSFSEILFGKLLQPLGVSIGSESQFQMICPSIGGGLRLSARDLMNFSLLHLGVGSAHPGLSKCLFGLRRRFPHTLDGGALNIRASYPGWFDFGGSFGHLGYGPESAGAIRLMPSKNTAIVISAQHKMLASAALSTLFKDRLPDTTSKQLVELLSQEDWKSSDISKYKGVYENSKYRAFIDTDDDGLLKSTFCAKGANKLEPHVEGSFRAAKGDLFVPASSGQHVHSFLRFSHLNSDRVFQFLRTQDGVLARKITSSLY